MQFLRRPVTLGVACALGTAALTSCAIDGVQKAAGEPAVQVTERDFKISAPRRLHAGTVNLAVTNRGPDAHELIVVRAHSRHLPIRADGLTVDEDKIEAREAGGLEAADPGVRTMSVRLKPGTYEFFCNMSGHYKAGMHRKLVVR